MNKSQILIALLCVGLLAGCGGGGSSSPSSKQPAQPVVLHSIQITPAAPAIAAGLSQQFIATGYYSDNTSANLTSSAIWSSSNTAIATVSNQGAALGKAPGSSVLTAAVSGVSGSATLTVTAPTLVSLAVSPENPSVPLGTTMQFSATGTFTDGSTQNMTAAVQWASSASSVAGINVNGTAGLAMGMALGNTSVSATSSGVSSSAILTVTPAVLSAIAISPSTVSIAQGTSLQFSATGTFTDGSKQDLSASVEWTSANPSVAGINLNGAPGLAKANAPGMATITAVSGSFSASALLTVTSATLSSVAVTPAVSSFPLGTLQQFTATGAFSDGTAQDITGTVGWSSSNNGVASITVSGLLTARNLGTVTITATSGSISGATSASVNAADLASIAILPGNVTIAATTSQQLSAVGTFNDGSTRDLTSQATWSSSSTTVAKVSASGLTKGLTPGTSTISVTLGPVSASVTLAVTSAQVVSISVTPAGSTIAPTTKLTLTATGSFDDGSMQIISRDAVWASDNPAIATVGSSGVITAVASGTANIQATLDAVSATVPVNVSSVTLTSIAVNPPSAVLAPASTLSYTARGTFSDGSTQIITNAVTWSSSAPNVASINNGLTTGQSAGATTITAQQGSIRGSADLIVESSPLISIQITPANVAIAQQTATQFRAIGTFADGGIQDLTNSVSWTASPLSVATVSEAAGTKGLAAGIAPGVATITALFAGQVGTASLTVSSASLISITITPNGASVPAGSSQQFIATGNFSDGTTQMLTMQATWASSTINVATVTGSGLVNTASAGTTTISASMNGVSGSTVLAVY